MAEIERRTPQRRFREFRNSPDWEKRKLGELLSYEQPTKYIVKSTNYDNSFIIPVLTAGQSFILGYTNETNGVKVAHKQKPVIIFDDFTTGLHYVDFSFKIKSSAMKILDLKSEEDDFYFVYNTLKNIKYTPKGHERHWISKFSKFDVFVPKHNEQQKIGSFFKKLDDTIALHQRKLDKLKRLKAAYLEEMFPKEGETIPKRRFAGFSGEWEQLKLGENTNILAGGTPKTFIPSYWSPKEVPWMSSGEVNKQRLDSTDNMISEEGLNSSNARWVKKHSILIALAGQGKTRGTVPINNIPLTTNQSIAAIEPNENLYYEFVYQNLTKRYDELRMLSSGDGTRGGLNKHIISDINISCPTLEEQQKIGSFFKQLDDTITLYQRKIDKLKELKLAYLNEMFV